jgi:alkylation response protein AidB-like acyl-CoA dehydrogenase
MVTLTGSTATSTLLTDDMLARFGERAPIYDRDNRFFDEDFEELRASGYLTCAVPADLGGGGLSLADVCRLQRRLAYRAPATALAVNMHTYWTGVAADLRRFGDNSLEWILREAMAGEIFAAGHGEAGNDLPVLLSTAKAERVDGGYRFTGHKMFGSLTPVWTRLGVHAMDTSDATGPKIVHGFLPRSSEGYTIRETWNTLGMRATRSDDTVLDGAFVPDKYIARVVAPGALDPFIGDLHRPRRARPRRGNHLGPQAHLAGAVAADGLPPRGPAPVFGDAARARVDVAARRKRRRGLVGRR